MSGRKTSVTAAVAALRVLQPWDAALHPTVVNGMLRFEREVDLYLGESAMIGPVEGVEPRRYAIGAADAG
ncbi:MAG TPA: hypothetical protein VLH36_14575 [Steroidobacteraceae bacterium]|nr:hypothetical protein [Steroidobacteraceae bacterium]